MSGLLEETEVRNPAKAFVTLQPKTSAPHPTLFFCEGCFCIPLLRDKSCYSTTCRLAGDKLIFPFPCHSSLPLVVPSLGSAGLAPMHLSAIRFTSLTESSSAFY